MRRHWRARLHGAMLLAAAGPAGGQPQTPLQASEPERPLLPPAVQWDHFLPNPRPALQQTAHDLADPTGGVGFAMSPANMPEAHPVIF